MKSYEELGGDATGTRIGDALFADYAEAEQVPNSGMGVWFWRTSYDAQSMPLEQAIAKHRREWRQVLGLPGPQITEAPIAPREYRGNMCGVRVPGVSAVPGGAADPSLVLSWFYDRYSLDDRQRIVDAWIAKGYYDVLLSWPDSRAIGETPESFAQTCQGLVSIGFMPCVMLLSKDHDPHDVTACLVNAQQILPHLLSPRLVSRICVGWELSLWLSPEAVQTLVDAIAPPCVAAGVKCYVHFQQGYSHFAPDSPITTFASYWNRQVGKLTGILHQADLNWSVSELQSRYNDILVRFAGQFFCSPDSGFGHPFDCIALELTAAHQYAGSMSEAQGDETGRAALASPVAQGPFGVVKVMGSGNGS